MKKLLAIFASLAVAATLCIGLAACGGGTDGDKSVTNKEEWDQAIKDTLASTNFTIKMTMKNTPSEGGVFEATGETNVDFDKQIAGQTYDHKSTLDDETSTYVVKYYQEIVDGTYNSYEFEDYSSDSDDGVWEANSEPAGAEKIAAFKAEYSLEYILFDFTLNFEDFTYDEKTHTYTHEETNYDEVEKVTISFRKGKVYRVYVETNGTGDNTDSYNMEYIVTYGKAKGDIPKEAKDALNK